MKNETIKIKQSNPQLIRKNCKALLLMVIATAFAPLAASNSLEALVRGESRDLASDSERYFFLKYETLRSNSLKGRGSLGGDITTCGYLEGKSLHLLSDFAVMKSTSPLLYRDLSYCYYLENVGLDVSNVETIKSWLTKNETRVHFNYSYEKIIEHYVSLTKYTDWDCSNFRNYLSDYEIASGLKYPKVWTSYTHHCVKN
ncbi:hypothetical protein F0267_28640 [Vibrio coralliilyticus]|uniref:Uncharacterized protein n=1 Tax=Vibrio coralliilyticus TaxID=190893 RepID=A0AAN0W042_9VIBR|nr:hypothetical protein [Vibrio coralliilyticus]AIW22503.1 hypothetical protein IX92_25910 [Vibrio coralliilyticus]NOH42195.1 hypothetical protein [Vibrio coralliilyticus]